MDELAGHRQRVIQGQQEGLTERHHPRFLGLALRVVWRRLWRCKASSVPSPLAPFRNRVAVEVVNLSQCPVAYRLRLGL